MQRSSGGSPALVRLVGTQWLYDCVHAPTPVDPVAPGPTRARRYLPCGKTRPPTQPIKACAASDCGSRSDARPNRARRVGDRGGCRGVRRVGDAHPWRTSPARGTFEVDLPDLPVAIPGKTHELPTHHVAARRPFGSTRQQSHDNAVPRTADGGEISRGMTGEFLESQRCVIRHRGPQVNGDSRARVVGGGPTHRKGNTNYAT